VALTIVGNALRFVFFLASGGRSSNGRTPDSGYVLNHEINRSDRCTYVEKLGPQVAPEIAPPRVSEPADAPSQRSRKYTQGREVVLLLFLTISNL